MGRPGSTDLFIVPCQPTWRSKSISGDGYKAIFDLLGDLQLHFPPPGCQVGPVQLPEHDGRTRWVVSPAFVKHVELVNFISERQYKNKDKLLT